MRYLICLLLLVSLGCAAQPLSTIPFTKPDTTDADFRRDSYACERDVQMIQPVSTPYGGLIAITAIKEAEDKQRAMYIRCMESKGWVMGPLR